MSAGRKGPIVNPIKAILRRSKRRYLDSRKGSGGFLQEWQTVLEKEVKADTEVKLLVLGLLRISSEKIWHEATEEEDIESTEDDAAENAAPATEASSIEPELPFMIDNQPVKNELRFRAPSTPGGYRTVLAEPHGRVKHLFGQATITMEKATQTVAAANRQLGQANTALTRADGDADVMIKTVVDGGPWDKKE